MDAAILEAASAAWASLSGIAVLLLGIVALTGGRARPPGSAAFGGFAIVWGLHILAGRWMAYAPIDLAPRVHLAFLALLLPLPYLLVQFARAFARDAGRSRAWRTTSAATIALGLVGALVLLVAPDLVYEGLDIRGERAFPIWGDWYAPLAIFPFFGALGLALLALDHARRASMTARTTQRHALLAAGLATFTAFSAANNLAFYATDVFTRGPAAFAGAYVALFGTLTVLCVHVGLRAARDAARAPRTLGRPARILALATLAPLAWGLVEGALAYELLPRFNTVGLWRLAGIAMLAYALAKLRMPDLAPSSRETTATAVGVAGAAASGGLVIGIFLLFAPGVSLLLLAGVAVPLATLSPSVRLARRALRVEKEPDLSDATLPRRLETYRAALEAAVARNTLDEDARFLAALRDRLGVSADVHDALLCIARDCVLPPPDEMHPGYERLRLLGEGAHGRAWLARRRADDTLVVLKEPADRSAAARESLALQARVAQDARHPRIVNIHHVVDAPRPFLVMDHLPGGSLADRLERGPVSGALATRLVVDVLEGLDALHHAGVTHGDVKPANVLLDAEGRAHLSDFGLVRIVGADATRPLAAGEGTLCAMAPEQVLGAPATPSSDLYATGALLYRLLTGEHYVALDGLDETRARDAVLTHPPRLPHARVPSALEAVLRRALAKDPAARYASALAMRDALEAAG